MANSVWSTPPEPTRGGARARAFDLQRLDEGSGAGIFTGDLTHGRRYSEDELWDNFEFFILEVKPVAQDAGVRIGIHPDDPPGLTLGGVPRPIFSSFDSYKRAIDIADSMGEGPLETIRYFGERGKIFKVHYRTIDQPLPHFIEAFIDDGYFDMAQAMKALADAGCDCAVIPDHIPLMGDDGRVGTAYTIGWMKATLARANAA
jgi:mannonate dehydratase